MKNKIEGNNIKIIKTYDELLKGSKEIADKLNKDYEGKEVLWMTIMRGGIMFSTETSKHLNFKVKFDFIRARSYDLYSKVSKPEINYSGDEDIKGKHIILVDDLIDTGESIKYLYKYLSKHDPLSISVVSMFSKVDDLNLNIKKYIAFNEKPSGFLVGYGLDIKGYYRNLPYIAIIEKEGNND